MCEEFESEREFEPQIFSNFPAHDLNFHEREGDEIKSKQASKRDRTLLALNPMQGLKYFFQIFVCRKYVVIDKKKGKNIMSLWKVNFAS